MTDGVSRLGTRLSESIGLGCANLIGVMHLSLCFDVGPNQSTWHSIPFSMSRIIYRRGLDVSQSGWALFCNELLRFLDDLF
jgi:hypothetical protein